MSGLLSRGGPHPHPSRTFSVVMETRVAWWVRSRSPPCPCPPLQSLPVSSDGLGSRQGLGGQRGWGLPTGLHRPHMRSPPGPTAIPPGSRCSQLCQTLIPRAARLLSAAPGPSPAQYPCRAQGRGSGHVRGARGEPSPKGSRLCWGPLPPCQPPPPHCTVPTTKTSPAVSSLLAHSQCWGGAAPGFDTACPLRLLCCGAGFRGL